MRKKLEAIQSNPRVFATLVLNGPTGYYIYRLLSGVDGLQVQVSRMFATKKEAADHMFLRGAAWSGVHDHVGTEAHQAQVNGATPAMQPMAPNQGQPQQPGYPPQQYPQGGYPPPQQPGYPPQQYGGRIVNGGPRRQPGIPYQGQPMPPRQGPAPGNGAPGKVE